MKRIKEGEKLLIYKSCSVHFWNMIHPKKLWHLQNRFEVSMRSKVRGFYGNFGTTALLKIPSKSIPISGTFQCSNLLNERHRGACPDEIVGGVGSYQIMSSSRSNGLTSVTYRRPYGDTGPADCFYFVLDYGLGVIWFPLSSYGSSGWRLSTPFLFWALQFTSWVDLKACQWPCCGQRQSTGFQ
jgi:hypothetical protein